ncbi:hypothetical protein M0811_14323 [Anaeramoeba ignava]|uniref:Uncharacterized protein n=1 Tax=Anaeramoeba ignava TaxID=1746090 RepID=A0A9Q0RHL7_ANAIG|nr:hypothetical protein M0811_14323 [Anaeramoeba ignava]
MTNILFPNSTNSIFHQDQENQTLSRFNSKDFSQKKQINLSKKERKPLGDLTNRKNQNQLKKGISRTKSIPTQKQKPKTKSTTKTITKKQSKVKKKKIPNIEYAPPSNNNFNMNDFLFFASPSESSFNFNNSILELETPFFNSIDQNPKNDEISFPNSFEIEDTSQFEMADFVDLNNGFI